MEHLEHFGLSQEPFGNDPVLDFYFPSRQHVEAEKRVLRCVRQRKGLCLLLGEGGLGKTMLARHLLDELDEERFEASLLVMVQRGADTESVIARIARQLGLESRSGDATQLLSQVYEQLVEIHEEGRQTLVIIDEAQMLATRGAMEALRGLLNLEHEERHLLSLVLIGSAELQQTIALDPPLAERIDVRVQLGSLDADNVADYVAHRLRLAGGSRDILDPDAVIALHRLARGIPRLINTLADNALYEAYLAHRRHVQKQDVEHAARDLGVGESSAPARAPDPAPAALAAPPRGVPNAPDPSATVLVADGIPQPGPSAPDPSETVMVPDATLAATQVIFSPEEGEVVGAPRPEPAGLADPQLVENPPQDEELDDLFAELLDD